MIDKPTTEVTTFSTYCFCPIPDLDDKDVCKICDTQWQEKEA